MTDAVDLASFLDLRDGQGNARSGQREYSTRSRLVITVHHSLTRKEGEDG